MAVDVIMPKAGMAMEEGTILKWLKKEGEKVEAGEPLLEIQTDKVSMEVEAPASGVLIKILGTEGDVVPVTKTIGYIGKPGENIKDFRGDIQKDPGTDKNRKETSSKPEMIENRKKLKISGDRVAATPLARTIAEEKGIDLRKITGTGSSGEIKAADVNYVKAVSATPLAKRIAEDKNIDLERIQGSGFNGKIRKEDLVSGHISEEKAFSAGNAVKAAALDNPENEFSRKPIKGMRKVIADRMLKSHLEVPPVTLNSKADVTELMALRGKINTALGIKISVNDFILKAVACALSESPDININIAGNDIVLMQDINVGMAVALDDGLIVPVLKNINTLSLKQISSKSRELAKKAKDGKLMPDEYTGGTFTVSNLGMFDVLSFTPIINQPEAAILGVCAVEDQLKMSGDKIENRSFMGLSLTFDHRVIDGAQGAVFLKEIKSRLENPLELIV